MQNIVEGVVCGRKSWNCTMSKIFTNCNKKALYEISCFYTIMQVIIACAAVLPVVVSYIVVILWFLYKIPLEVYRLKGSKKPFKEAVSCHFVSM